MELHEYPRPDNDTGIGVHWVAGFATAVGLAKIREYWLPELKALGVKWVKIYNHDSAIDFAELLLAEGLMPIIRIYQATPNPSRLGLKEIVHLEALVRAGVRYFEFNHEPDRDESWRSGRVPADGLNLVVENTIANLELILEKGGMPAVPALSGASRWDLVGKIVQQGRRDLFQGPIWHAIHNYSLNRPLDYPYDIGNQEGAAYTARFFRAVAEEEWGENAWRGRSLAEVNRLRMQRSNPGTTTVDDHACWLAYEYWDELNRRHLGRSIPILATECGYLVGEDTDARYPATTPDLHMAQTLEACRIMMGTSARFKPAPDYYFCTAFWLLANAKLGSSSNWWEGHAWYSDRWHAGALPIVHALRAEPKVVRRWQGAGEVGMLASIYGLALNSPADTTVVLAQNGRDLKRTQLDSQHRYRFADLLPGQYSVRVEGAAAAHVVELTPARNNVVVNFDLGEQPDGTSASVVSGTVAGGAGAIVLLLRASDGEEWVTLAQDDGGFRFVDLPAGQYSVRVHPDGSRVNAVRLDGSNEVRVSLHTFGWGYTVQSIEPAPGQLTKQIYCRIKGHNRVPVQAIGPEWESETVYTGSAPDLGPFMCQITAAEYGSCLVVARDLRDASDETTTVEARVRVDSKRIALVDFVFSQPEATPPAAQSTIAGHVIGGFVSGIKLEVALIDAAGQRRVMAVDDDGKFSFTELAAGRYSVEVIGHTEAPSETDIALDGSNTVHVELVLPSDLAVEQERRGRSVLAGYVPDASGRVARLVDTVGNTFTRVVDGSGNFQFENLPAGSYALTVDGGYVKQPLELDGVAGTEVLFSPLIPRWDVDISQAGSMPGYSAVRVEVEGLADHPVSIWQDDGVDRVQRTGSNPRLGKDVVEFKPLEPGHYMVRPHDIDTVAAIDLTGLEAIWITFRRRDEPITPHLVRPLVRVGVAEVNGAGRHYLFVGDHVAWSGDLERLLRYVAETGPVVGGSVEEACTADYVTIVGAIDERTLAALSAANTQVRHFEDVRNEVGG